MKSAIINRLVALERVQGRGGKVLCFIEEGPDDFILDGEHVNLTELDAIPARKKVIYFAVSENQEELQK